MLFPIALGGNTKFPGFEKRLYQELSELFDEKTTIKVRSLPNRELLGWIGGARYVLIFKTILSICISKSFSSG